MKTKVQKMNANDARNMAAEKARKAAANEKRLETMRKNLAALEARADELLAKGDSMTAADRMALLNLVNVAYHSSGKIEGCFSVDGSASCDFCKKMIKAAGDNILIICGACYAAADAWKEAAWRRHKLNARILSSVLFTAEELTALHIDGTRCRFNEDGDTVNQVHGQNLLRIAETRPACWFGYWYKNQPAVEAALHAEGIHCRADLPANVRFVHSSALIGFPVRACWHDDATFTVYPDAGTTLEAVAAGAHECNGKRCRACGYFCYVMQRQESAVNIAEVLRCKPGQRAAYMAAYLARREQIAAVAG